MCCKWADNGLVCSKRGYPSVRISFTSQSFDFMSFNTDFVIKSDDDRLFV